MRVFVSGVTHVEVQLGFRLFENKDQRPKNDVFEAFFIAAGTFMAIVLSYRAVSQNGVPI